MSRPLAQDVWNGPVKLGAGFKDFANAVARRLDAEHAQREARERAEADKYQYAGNTTYYLMVRKLPHGHIRVESVDEFPMIGRLAASGRNIDVALTNLRLEYARALVQKRLLDWDDATAYAVERTDFRFDLGSV